jgi:hypothetical protein
MDLEHLPLEVIHNIRKYIIILCEIVFKNNLSYSYECLIINNNCYGQNDIWGKPDVSCPHIMYVNMFVVESINFIHSIKYSMVIGTTSLDRDSILNLGRYCDSLYIFAMKSLCL